LALVVISPNTITMPVLVAVSQATCRFVGRMRGWGERGCSAWRGGHAVMHANWRCLGQIPLPAGQYGR
jgi:hypothetical protein